MKSETIHEVYFQKQDYYRYITKYQGSLKGSLTPEELLLTAKGYFTEQQYKLCLDVIERIQPLHSTKILFESQSLLFRATYLSKCRQKPNVEHLERLTNILDYFQTHCQSTPGPKINANHKKIFANYRQFLTFFSEIFLEIVVFNKKLFSEQISQQNYRRKYEGFPCYLVTKSWISEFKSALDNKQNIYFGPLTNYALINDIFQADFSDNPLEEYKNTFVLPNEKYYVFSKIYWTFLNSICNKGKQFGTIKRIAREQNYKNDSKQYKLVPIAVQYQQNISVMQLSPNSSVDRELMVILKNKFGFGQLRVKQFENVYQIFDYEGHQRDLQKNKCIFNYQKATIPKDVHESKYTPLLRFQFKPLPENSFTGQQNGLKGLQNMGNSCYLNSCIQCLSFTHEITQELCSKDLFTLINFGNSDGIVAASFSDLLKMLWSVNQQKSTIPRKFKKYFGLKNSQFSGKTQEDAHQFLLCLLNNLHEQLKNQSKLLRRTSKLQITHDQKRVRQFFEQHQLQQNGSIIMNNFRGKIHNTMQCGNCKVKSHSYDLFLALTLPIPQKECKFIDIYYSAFETRQTKKYRVYIENVENLNDIFKIFKDKVFDKDDKLAHHYIFGNISRENLTFGYMASFNFPLIINFQFTISQLLQQAQRSVLIFYELEMKDPKQILVIIQYRLQKHGLVLGFPKIFYLKQQIFGQNASQRSLKQMVVEKDKENMHRYIDLQAVIVFQRDQKVKDKQSKPNNIFKFTLQTIFHTRQILFKGAAQVYDQINDPNSESYGLNDCFNMMRSPEILENSWKCGQCNSNQKVQKKQQIIDANHILVIHLKRFKADFRKIKKMVNYPIHDLDISQWIQTSERRSVNSYIYDLYAICLHSGTVDSGHYRAYCKHFISGQWYEFDDSMVKKINQEKIVTPQAYMLFYRRKDI